MDVKRILSQSIIIDRVTERLEREKYLKHVSSLEKIGQSIGKDQFLLARQRQEQYEDRLNKMNKSRSYVKSLFDARSIENESLMKRMDEIDRRKPSHQSCQKKLPIIKNSKSKTKQEAIRKENQLIVERIMNERRVKSKEKMLEEHKTYQRYRENLRKIKGTATHNRRLRIVR